MHSANDDDITYFERRAEAQLALAQQSLDPQAVQAHYQLAAAYLDRIHSEPADLESKAAA